MCFFAKRDLKAGTELTFKYSGDTDDVVTEETKEQARSQLEAVPTGTPVTIKKGLSVLRCKCGTEKCGGFLYRTGRA